MTITTEELQRLMKDHDEGRATDAKGFTSLELAAPYLARRVLAAEKMAVSLDWVASNARFAHRENIRSVAQEAIEKYESSK